MARFDEIAAFPNLPDQFGVRHYGDGIAGQIGTSRIQGYYSGGAQYLDVAVNSDGSLVAQLKADPSIDIGSVEQGAGSGAAGSYWVQRLTTGAAFYDARDRNWTLASGTDSVAVSGAVNQGTAGAAEWLMGGGVASGSADSGNPVKAGGKYNSTQPTFSDGNRGDLQLDSRGRLRVIIGSGTVEPVVASLSDSQNRTAASLLVSAAPALDNGTNLERARGNWNTTTGDTGTKTTGTFNGATQTNFNARGAIITARIGTVTGAVTTFQTGIQWSPDGGTTWLGLTALGANDTAVSTGKTYTWIVYPTNTSQAAGTTPANLAPASGPTQLNAVNAALPRTWRWTMSLTVATSLVLTEVDVNYIL